MSPSDASAEMVAPEPGTPEPTAGVVKTKRAATIYDIAQLAGVNPSTVSRALSRPGASRAAGFHASVRPKPPTCGKIYEKALHFPGALCKIRRIEKYDGGQDRLCIFWLSTAAARP